jgi:hypothetical protein
MSKMGLHDPFEHLNHKLWPKEGPGIKLAIWLMTTTSQEVPWFLIAPHTLRKLLTKVINLSSIEGLHTKLWALKVRESQFREFQDFNLGVMGQNDIWVLAPWSSIENTIRGKVVVSLESEPWWNLWSMFSRGEFVHQKCSNYALTNLLFGLYKFVWIVDLFVTHCSPIPKL